MLFFMELGFERGLAAVEVLVEGSLVFFVVRTGF